MKQLTYKIANDIINSVSTDVRRNNVNFNVWDNVRNNVWNSVRNNIRVNISTNIRNIIIEIIEKRNETSKN